MIIAKGYEVAFRNRKTGRKVAPPSSYALLQDPTGSDWPRCSILIAPVRQTSEEISCPEAEEYFGYTPIEMKLTLPPETLEHWNFVCEVDAIDYWRPGTKYEGDYDHYFKGRGWFFQEKHYPKLYRVGRIYRLEMRSGCTMNWRGIVYP